MKRSLPVFLALLIGLIVGSISTRPARADLSISGATINQVSGSVGSVVGNVGGNVVGTVASVVGNLGGNVVGNVNGSVNTLVTSNTYTPQAIQTLTYTTNTAVDVIPTTTEQGELVAVGFQSFTSGAAETISLNIVLDGGSTKTFSIPTDSAASGFDKTQIPPMCAAGLAQGATAVGTLQCFFHLTYKTSVRVFMSGGSGGQSLKVLALRAVRS